MYATIVTMLQNLQHRRDLTVLNYVTNMLSQSKNNVPSLQLQNYVFIHEVILDHI